MTGSVREEPLERRRGLGAAPRAQRRFEDAELDRHDDRERGERGGGARAADGVRHELERERVGDPADRVGVGETDTAAGRRPRCRRGPRRGSTPDPATPRPAGAGSESDSGSAFRCPRAARRACRAVARRAPHREQMVDVPRIELAAARRWCRRAGERGAIRPRQRTAPLGPARQELQPRAKDGGLHLVEPRVHAELAVAGTDRSGRRCAAASRARRSARRWSSAPRRPRARRDSSSGRSCTRRPRRSCRPAGRRTWPGAPGSSLRRSPGCDATRPRRSPSCPRAVRRGARA